MYLNKKRILRLGIWEGVKISNIMNRLQNLMREKKLVIGSEILISLPIYISKGQKLEEVGMGQGLKEC